MCHKKRLAGIVKTGNAPKSRSSQREITFPISTVLVFTAKALGLTVPGADQSGPGRQSLFITWPNDLRYRYTAEVGTSE